MHAGDSYDVVQNSGTFGVGSMRIGPLDVRNSLAVRLSVCTIKNVVVFSHESNILGPLKDLLCPFRVSLISCGLGEASREEEEISRAHAILVVVAIIEREDLPPQSAIACLIVPSSGLVVEHRLGSIDPFSLLRVLESHLGGSHGSQRPSTLVIVTERFGLVHRHIVSILAKLELEGFCDHIIKLGVSSQVRIFDQGAPDSAEFPPIIRVAALSEQAGCNIGISVIVSLNECASKSFGN